MEHDPATPAADAEPAAELAVIEAAATVRIHRVDRLLEQWKTECLNNGPASRDTAGYNHLVTTALPELRRRLMQEIA